MSLRFIISWPHYKKHRTLRLSGAPTQLNKEARSWRVRSRRLFGLRSFIAYSEFHQRQLVDGSDPAYTHPGLWSHRAQRAGGYSDAQYTTFQPIGGALFSPRSSARFARIN